MLFGLEFIGTVILTHQTEKKYRKLKRKWNNKRFEDGRNIRKQYDRRTA